MHRLLGQQSGQALALVMAFMVLSVPLITSALTLASTLSIDSQVKTRILKSQYAALGCQQWSLHILLDAQTSFTTTTVINGRTCTATATQVDPGAGIPPLPPIADPSRKFRVTKTVTPTSTPATSGNDVTYTIKVENRVDKPMKLNHIHDYLPPEFRYENNSSVLRSSTGTVINLDNPSGGPTDELTWSPTGLTIAVSDYVTQEFVVEAHDVEGYYCNEASVEPGGSKTGSGKTARVRVGSSTETLCSGAAVTIITTVEPELAIAGTSTTFHYTVQIINEGTEVLQINTVHDHYHPGNPGFSWTGAATSTPIPIPGGQPKERPGGTPTELEWKYTPFTSLATSTTWTLQFDLAAELPRGQYSHETEVDFQGGQLPSQTTWPTAYITIMDYYVITVDDGQTVYTCDVYVGTDGNGDDFFIVENCTAA